MPTLNIGPIADFSSGFFKSFGSLSITWNTLIHSIHFEKGCGSLCVGFPISKTNIIADFCMGNPHFEMQIQKIITDLLDMDSPLANLYIQLFGNGLHRKLQKDDGKVHLIIVG